MALQKGVRIGTMQIIDSVHSIANVNTSKDQNRQDKGKGPQDPDARWGAKHKRKVETEDGKEGNPDRVFLWIQGPCQYEC